MAPQHIHRFHALTSVGAPALIPAIMADVDTSVGVVGLIAAILVLVCVLLAVIVIEARGEHRQDAEFRHRR